MLITAPDHQRGPAGELVTYTIQVYNIGAYENVYDLFLSYGVWQVKRIPSSIGLLLPGGQPAVDSTVPDSRG